ncbi:uncharacterized protein LOC116348570, partial [Contarinia nasturtii]|uniref:uncharacterized protein LOC116348570 n=1 Tax=Contarinia nasturtii TaxID=265458 RepID=UPI0012D3A6C3
MASKKRKDTQFPELDELETTYEITQGSSTKRSKNFSLAESTVLIKICDKFHTVITKNSNRDKDKQAKAKAWGKICAVFNKYCKDNKLIVEDRTIDQLQTKYKALKKDARKVGAKVKRDFSKTGNKPLKTSTINLLEGNNPLLQLRARMGASGSGFASKHCSDALPDDSTQDHENEAIESAHTAQPFVRLNRIETVTSGSMAKKRKIDETSENVEPIEGQTAENYTPRPVRERRKTQFHGTNVDSQSITLSGTDEEYTDDMGELYHDMSSPSETPNLGSGGKHLSMQEAIDQLMNINEIQTLPQSTSIDSLIDIDKFLDATMLIDEESSTELNIDVQQALDERAEIGKLTGPPDEVRRRYKRVSDSNLTSKLRQKQLELVEQQLEVQKVLHENAIIANEEAKERLQMVKAQREIAEIDK